MSARCLLCCLLLFFSVFLNSCQIRPRVPDNIPSAESITVSEETDYGCAYFYFLWGRNAELTMRYDEALEAYEKALICDPQADYVARKIPVILLRLERLEEAISWLEQALVTHPKETGMRMLLAKIYIRQNNFAAAAQQYKMVHEQNPEDISSLLLLSELLLTEEKLDQAAIVLDKVLQIDEQSYSAYVMRARLYLLDGKTKRALGHYRKALAINWSAQLQMEISQVYLRQNQYKEAEAIYRDILEHEEENEDARIALVHVLLLQNREEQALAELDRLKIITDYPERVDLTIARLYARSQDYERAIALLKDILAEVNLPRARFLYATIEFQREHYEEALVQLRFIAPSAEEYEESLFFQVRILRASERLDDAVDLLEKNILTPGVVSVDLYVLLAALYQLQGKGDLGEATFHRALNAYPKDDELLYEYGLYLDQEGSKGQALEIMQQVISREPQHAAALNYVGYTWAEKKIHLDRALEYIQRAVKLRPENGYIRDSLGWVYFRLGKLDRAKEELEKAADLSPDDPAIYDHLGDVYLEIGNVQMALDAYDRAIELSPEEEGKKPILEKIRILMEQLGQ